LTNLSLNFRNFILFALNVRGRAAAAEYWTVVPIIWVVILIAFWRNLQMVETYLLAHERPPTNPLTYSCVVIFLITLVPRFSLNIRRLHDIGRSCIWTFIPAVASISSLAVGCALLGSFMNSGLTGKPDAPDDFGHLIYPVTLFMTSQEKFWEEMFTIAMVLDATGMKAINNLMAEVYSMNGAVDVRRSNINLRREIWGDLGHTYLMAVTMFALTALPLVTGFAHLFFLSFLSHPGKNKYGKSKIANHDETNLWHRA